MISLNTSKDVSDLFDRIVAINACICGKSYYDTSNVLSSNSIYSAIGAMQWYSTASMQASCLFRSLILNHGFKDGNKRTAVVCASFIQPYTCSEDECIECAVQTAQGCLTEVSEICHTLYGGNK